MRFPYSTTSCQLAIVALASLFVLPSLSFAQSQTPAILAPSAFHEPTPLRFDDDNGFEQIFDGLSLKGWEGDPAVWWVIDGAIVGESTRNKPVSNTYIWRKGLVVKNFDLKLEIKCEIGGGSGIQYRSQTGLPWLRPLQPGEKPRNLSWMMTGPQADIWFPINPQSAAYTGQFYSENTPLGILAWRSEIVERGPNEPPTLLDLLGNRDELGGYVRINDCNQYEIVAAMES